MNGECPATGKVRFTTARAAYAEISQIRWGRQTKVQPRRVYFCKQCQGYHLSSKGNIWGRRQRLSERKQRLELDEIEPEQGCR